MNPEEYVDRLIERRKRGAKPAIWSSTFELMPATLASRPAMPSRSCFASRC